MAMRIQAGAVGFWLGAVAVAIVASGAYSPALAADEEADAEMIQGATLAGVVVDSQDKPVAGALIAASSAFGKPIVALGRSDDEGRFLFQWDTRGSTRNARLFVRGAGYGVVTRSAEDFDVRGPAGKRPPRIQLPDAATIRGRLVNEAGEAVAGARVRPYQVMEYGQQGRATLTETVKEAKYPHEFEDAGLLVMQAEATSEVVLPWVETDAEGMFAIDSVGPNCLVGLFVVGPRTVVQTILVRTDDGPEVPSAVERNRAQAPIQARDGFERVVTDSVPVRGTVQQMVPQHGITDFQSLVPQAVVGARVSVSRLPGFHFDRAERLLTVRTNFLSQYELMGLPKGTHDLFAELPNGKHTVAVEREIDLGGESAIEGIDFTLLEGIVISGQVTDHRTGQPVAGTISAYVFPENPYLNLLRPSTPSGARHSVSVGEDGKFEIALMPGPGLLAFRADGEVSRQYQRGSGWRKITLAVPQKVGDLISFRARPYFVTAVDYHQLTQINPLADRPRQTVNISLGQERVDVPLEIARPGNRTSTVYYSNESSDHGPFSLLTYDYSRQDLAPGVIRFFPGEGPRVVQAHDRELEFAGWTYVAPTDQTAKLELAPAAKVRGRVLKADGSPLVRAAIASPFALDISQKVAALASQPDAGYYPRTDAEGRFEILGIPADLPFTLMISEMSPDGRQLLSRRYLLDQMSFKAGESRDLGELTYEKLREWKPTPEKRETALLR